MCRLAVLVDHSYMPAVKCLWVVERVGRVHVRVELDNCDLPVQHACHTHLIGACVVDRSKGFGENQPGGMGVLGVGHRTRHCPRFVLSRDIGAPDGSFNEQILLISYNDTGPTRPVGSLSTFTHVMRFTPVLPSRVASCVRLVTCHAHTSPQNTRKKRPSIAIINALIPYRPCPPFALPPSLRTCSSPRS